VNLVLTLETTDIVDKHVSLLVLSHVFSDSLKTTQHLDT